MNSLTHFLMNAGDADADAGLRHDPQTDDIARAESGQMNRVQ